MHNRLRHLPCQVHLPSREQTETSYSLHSLPLDELFQIQLLADLHGSFLHLLSVLFPSVGLAADKVGETVHFGYALSMPEGLLQTV